MISLIFKKVISGREEGHLFEGGFLGSYGSYGQRAGC